MRWVHAEGVEIVSSGEKRLVKAEKVPENAGWSRSWRGREHKAWEPAVQERNLRWRSPGRIKKQTASSQREKKKIPVVQLARSKDLSRSKGEQYRVINNPFAFLLSFVCFLLKKFRGLVFYFLCDKTRL